MPPPDWWGTALPPVTDTVPHVTTGPVNAVAATNTLTTDNTDVSAAQTITVNGKVYTFRATTLTPAEGEVLIGANADATLLSLARAINGTGGTPGTDYFVAAAHPTVSSTATVTAHVITLTARTAGTAGNALTLTSAAAHIAVGAALFTGGVNGTVAQHGQKYEDGTYEYVCIGANGNAISGATWRRISLGSVY